MLKKRNNMKTFGLMLALPLASALAFASPHPADSVIIESKTVPPLTPPCGTVGLRVRIRITNKDTLANITLPLETKSTSGGAYPTLSRPSGCGERTFASVVDWLLPTDKLTSRILNKDNYHSNSPDTFLLAITTGNPADLSENMEPNLTRVSLLDLKFDTVSMLGQFVVDSGRVLGNSILFVDPQGLPIEVNFVKGVLTVAGGGCGIVTPCPPPGATILYGRGYTQDYNTDCDVSGVTWSVVVGPGSISPTGLYSFNGECPLGFIPVIVRAFSHQSGTFSECPFTLFITDNPPMSSPMQDAIVVSHGQFASNQILASDPNPGDSVSFTGTPVNGPGFTDSTGLWFLSTGCGDVAASPQTVRVRVTDYFSNCKPGPASSDCEFVLIVTNSPPGITNCPNGSFNLDTNVQFSYPLSATDADPADSSVNFFLVSAPVGLSVSSSGFVQWTPSPSQRGVRTAVFRAMDGCGAFTDCAMSFNVSIRRGDLNGDGSLTPADMVLLLNCVFAGGSPSTGGGSCDLNCDGQSSPIDVVLEFFAIFLGDPFPC